MWKKLQRWKEKLLSQVGREVLIKAVIQTIPTYMMSCFKLPKVLIKDLEILTRKFGGGMAVIVGRFTGSIGRNFAKLKMRVAWGSKN